MRISWEILLVTKNQFELQTVNTNMLLDCALQKNCFKSANLMNECITLGSIKKMDPSSVKNVQRQDKTFYATMKVRPHNWFLFMKSGHSLATIFVIIIILPTFVLIQLR